jgi:hypothetical protein
MRTLGFPGYLESYVLRLSGGKTLAVKELASRATREPRLVEPLLLWAVETGRSRSLHRVLGDGSRMARELETLESLERQGTLERALASEDSPLGAEYQKVWRSYRVRANAPKRDAELKLEARRRVLELEATKSVSRYRMAKDLGLNPGNLHAYLAQGKASKLSLERALSLVDYLEAA